MIRTAWVISCAFLAIAAATSTASSREAAEEGAATDDSAPPETVAASEVEPSEPPGPGHAAHNREVFLKPHPEMDTLTRGGFGLGKKLRDLGVTSTLNLWIAYQGNVSGGLSASNDVNGLYWFANHFDLERLVGLPGAAAYVLVEGGWNEGINQSVGALMNVNGTAVGDEPIGVTRLWYDQKLFSERLRLRLGKIDVTTENFEFHGRSVAFDAMPYANTPRTQFVGAGLVNNASVPFPAAALAGMLLVEPLERWYFAAAGFDRQSDAFDWSYSGAFEEWMVIAETGVVVSMSNPDLCGSYSIGYWYSTFPGAPAGQGVYVGVAQELYREPGTEDEGLGLFARYGYADRNPSGIRHYWSLGGEYRGLVPGRDDDTLALGWAQAFTPGGAFSAPYEGVFEFYYRAGLTKWLHVSPHIQYVANPGSSDADDAWTLGIRGQITF